eukprot:TRINITY_DN10735_c0_g1_i1.p1 TRINITY_DN10735_c0_g1~~TRINITY_DN10735_c0_g1_i1.p1  ORF type:complete len:229 (+),score=53.31 TRINITY_DN10735_c0_g1_i1:64-687(+)
MKFGQSIKEQRLVFSNSVAKYIIDYKALKKRIGVMKKQEDKTEQQTMLQDWLKCFGSEMTKFDKYFEEAVEEIEEEMEELETHITDVPPKKPDLKEIYHTVQELRFFMNLNKTAARKILKKLDKQLKGEHGKSWFATNRGNLFAYRDDPLKDLAQRTSSIYASSFCQNRARIAEMELDYHVSCVNPDIFSYTMCHIKMKPSQSGTDS